MSYYNQNNYGAVAYPHAARPNATVKSSGCGVCCISMVIEGLTDERFPPAISASWAISAGARAAGGTDMVTLGRAAAKRFDLRFQMTSSPTDLIAAIKRGAYAIANVGGNRGAYKGLFSVGGHYVVVRGYSAGQFIVWDPGYYKGKFNQIGRSGKVAVSGNDIWVLPALLDADCSNRRPRYYTFERDETVTQAQFDQMMDNYLKRRAALPAEKYAEDFLTKAFIAGITDGERPKAFATREEVVTMIMRSKQE